MNSVRRVRIIISFNQLSCCPWITIFYFWFLFYFSFFQLEDNYCCQPPQLLSLDNYFLLFVFIFFSCCPWITIVFFSFFFFQLALDAVLDLLVISFKEMKYIYKEMKYIYIYIKKLLFGSKVLQ